METKRLTIIDFVQKYSQMYSEDTFLREKVGDVWTETSYTATWEEGKILAAGFMALGLEKDDKVALLAEGRNQWIFTELGILFAGAVNVPMSYKLESDKDLIFRINHSDSRFVVVSEGQLPKIRRVIDRCPAIEKVIIMDPVELQKGEMYLSEVRQMGVDFIAKYPEKLQARMDSVQPDDYANISYTSGTTADPKGILLTHRNYTANVEQCQSVIRVDRGDIMLIVLPLDHCFAHVAGFYVMMSYGGSIATVPGGKNPVTMLKNIPISMKEVKPNVMLSVPAITRNFRKSIEASIRKSGPKVEKLYNFALNNAIAYNREYYNAGKPWWKLCWRKPVMKLMDKLVFAKVREGLGGGLKFMVGGGALLDIEQQRFFNAIGVPVFQGYGLSEATPVICSNSIGHARFGSSGRTVQPMEIKICDEEGNSLPAGQTGEIVIKGENVMAGYWKNPAATADTIVDGWLHTGDRGYLCADDPRYLYVTGRFKSLLIASDGEKYSPEGYEDSLTDGSKYIENSVLYNNQSPYTVVLVIPDKKALAEAVKKHGHDPATEDGRKAMLDLIQADVDAYRPKGKKAGHFPEKWLPAAIIVGDTPFTEHNGMLNSTTKMVRGKVEKFYEARLQYAMTPEGKNLYNQQNLDSLIDS